MPLHPDARAFLERMAATPQPQEVPLADFREAARALIPTGEKLALARVEDRVIPGGDGQDMAIRVYEPEATRPCPIVAWIHGGSFARGTLDMFDPGRRAFAKAAGCVVVAVDQRLSPEAQYPKPLEDAYAALLWAARNAGEFGADATRLGIAGESSGGAIAAAAARLARERGPALAFQVLVTPLLDASLSSPSVTEFAEGYLLTRAQLEWAYAQYAPGAAVDDTLLSPLLAPDLADLPPAVIVTMEYDPVRDDGERYAQRLARAGVRVKSARLGGMLHHFPGPDFAKVLTDLFGEILEP